MKNLMCKEQTRKAFLLPGPVLCLYNVSNSVFKCGFIRTEHNRCRFFYYLA